MGVVPTGLHFKICLILLQLEYCFSYNYGEESCSVIMNKCPHNKLRLFATKLWLPSTIMGNNVSTTFRLKPKCQDKESHCSHRCTSETFQITVDLTEKSSDQYFTPTGYLKYGSDFFHRDEYCVFRKTNEALVLEVCRPECGKSQVCVPKCCSAGKVINLDKNTCEYTACHEWKPLVYQTEDLQVCGASKEDIRFHYFQSGMKCQPAKYFPKAVQHVPELYRVRYRLLLNGSVVLKQLQSNEWKLPEQGKFCLDGVQTELRPYKGDPLDQILFVCLDDQDKKDEDHTYGKLTVTGILYSILLFSGTPFLLVTVIVYILLWHKQNIHGWTLFSHTLAILLNYLGQGVTNTVSRIYNSDDNASFSCKLIGILNHYFVLASFCWLTMINYDLWSMFRHLKNTVGRSKGLKRYLVYMAIGWGVPLLVVVISVVLDEKYGLYGDDGADCVKDIIVPLYGHQSCYMVEDARPFYLFYPIGTLMVVNLIFAGLTTYNMQQYHKGAKTVQLKSTKHQRKFSVWSKLFVVMGVALMSEVVVWNLKEKDVTLPWYLVFPDVLSLFQAIAIFILFACQIKIINQLREEYPSLKPTLDKLTKLPCYNNTTTKACKEYINLKPTAGNKL